MTFAQAIHDPTISYYLAALLVAWPLTRILNRAGRPKAWALLLLAPYVGHILALAALAARKWPGVSTPGAAAPEGDAS